MTTAKFLDWYGTHVITDPLDGRWVGSTEPSSKSAEAEALLWSMLWMMQTEDQRHICVHSDALTILEGAIGLWGFDAEDPLMRRLRATHQLLTTAWTDDRQEWQHIKAHNGHPGNEMADSLAVAIRKDETKAGAPPAVWYHGDTPAIEWAWATMDHYVRPGQVPDFYGGSLHWDDVRQAEYIPWLHLPTQVEPHRDNQTQVDFMMVSYNVSTLKQPARAANLRQQFHHYGIMLAGLQETRTKEDDIPDSTYYIRIIAAAQQGVGGCELWCARHLPFGCQGQEKIYITRDRLQVIYTDPQLLIVHIGLGAIPLLAVVAHAPHSGKGRKTQSEWWKALDRLLIKHGQGHHIVLFIDANATAARDPPHVGTLGAVEADGAAQDLGDLLRSHDLCLPISEIHHVGETHTWTSNDGVHSACIDYVAIPMTWMVFAISSRVHYNIDSGAGGIDHFAAGVHVQGTGMMQSKKSQLQKFDRSKMATASPETWIAFYKDWPAIDWTTPPTEHADRLNEEIHRRLTKCFPLTPETRKKGVIFSDSTWRIHAERGRLRRVLCHHGKALNKLNIHTAMQLWQGKDSLHGCYLRQLVYAIKMSAIFVIHQQVNKELHRFISHDRSVYLKSFAAQLNHVDKSDIMKRLKPLRMGKRVKDLSRKPLPMVCLENGMMAQTVEEAKARWRRHYAAMEGGSEVTPYELWHEDMRTRPPPPDGLDLKAIPTLTELEKLRASRPSKAMGYDGIPPELLHYSPHLLARHTWPLFFKQTLLGQECLQHKGGRLVSAYKRRGDIKDPSNHRALLVSSSLGKAFRNVYRRRVLHPMRSMATPLQVTAHSNPSVTLAAHIARCHGLAAKLGGLTDYALFVDIAHAFYQVIRQQAFNCTFADEEVMAFLVRMGVSEFSLQDVAEILEAGSSLAQSSCDPLLHTQVSEVHRSTWFVLQADTALIKTEKGTRPGDGFADVVWSLIFSRWSRQFERRLVTEELVAPYHWNGLPGIQADIGSHDIPHAVVIWADDVVVLGCDEEAERAPMKLQQTCVVLVEELLRFGLTPNFQKGKTEAIITPRGHGSQQIKRTIFNTMKCVLPLDTPLPGNPGLRLVNKYKHVGGRITYGAKLRPELQHRIAQAHQAYKVYRTKVYANTTIGIEARLAVLQATSMATLHYNAGTWSKMTIHEQGLWHTAHLKLYRGALYKLFPHKQLLHTTDDQILIMTKQHKPEITLRLLRLRWYGGAVRRDCPQLWASLALEQNWLQLVQEDLTWLYAQIHGYTNHPSPHEDLHYWHRMMASSPRRWAGLIKRAAKHHWLQWAMRRNVLEYHQRALEFLKQRAAPIQDAALEWRQSAFHCFQCNVDFDSYRGWAVHSFKRHAQVNRWRRLQEGTTCLSCGRRFPTASRLTRHLRSVSACAKAVASLSLWTEPQPYFGSSKVRLEEADMPLTVWEDTQLDAELTGQGQPMTTEMRDFLQAALGQPWQHGPKVEELEKALCELQVSSEEILEVEHNVKEAYPEFQQDIDLTFKELYAKARPEGMVVRRELTIAECIDGLSEMKQYEEPSPQRTPTSYRYILHLYSGVRRQGDFHTYMESLQPPDGHSFYVASVDLVLHATLGDLLDRKAQNHWLDMAAQGAVYAVLAGPPCESWSVARFRFHLTGEGRAKADSFRPFTTWWNLGTPHYEDPWCLPGGRGESVATFYGAINHHSMDMQWFGYFGTPWTSGSEARVPTTEHMDPTHFQIFDVATRHTCSTYYLPGLLGSSLTKADGTIGGRARCGRTGSLHVIEPYENQINIAESTWNGENGQWKILQHRSSQALSTSTLWRTQLHALWPPTFWCHRNEWIWTHSRMSSTSLPGLIINHLNSMTVRIMSHMIRNTHVN